MYIILVIEVCTLQIIIIIIIIHVYSYRIKFYAISEATIANELANKYSFPVQ